MSAKFNIRVLLPLPQAPAVRRMLRVQRLTERADLPLLANEIEFTLVAAAGEPLTLKLFQFDSSGEIVLPTLKRQFLVPDCAGCADDEMSVTCELLAETPEPTPSYDGAPETDGVDRSAPDHNDQPL